ncbi:hypothetical protein [Bosea sp. RAC05]|uniref:hypothetical protein n=1 Tax=Bosea sp. RAC05 TaxID=1842539 RepID=UPI0008579A68|nr:hypothetical protein [Bosea sp. RAC05]AOG03301.1 hypothetical protein BSY19_5009 [Bosea sp. RAC05]
MTSFLRTTAFGALVLAAGLALMPVPAHAQTTSFIAATCGTTCSDPLGEESAARSNWAALSAMGTTQYVGAAFNGGTIDASALLSASRIAGPVVLDGFLRTGQTSDQATTQAIIQALTVTGIDVSGITGVSASQSTNSTSSYNPTSSSDPYGFSSDPNNSSIASQLTQVLAGNTNGQFGSAGNSSNVACDQSIASAQVASAQQFVNNMVTIATSGDLGFSQNGGQAVSSGQRSQSGYFGSSCLDSLMQGKSDLLFRPPQLGQLISQLSSMFGGGGSGSGGSGSSGGGCGNAPSILSQVAQSMPSAIFSMTGNGGFLPHLAFGGEDGNGPTMNAFGLNTTPRTANTASTGGIASLFSR